MSDADRRTIRVVPYDPGWPGKFEQEAGLLVQFLGDQLLTCHHIGSTSVPGLAAKPIIDILLVVRGVDALDGFNSRFEQHGYACLGENGIPGRRYFRKGSRADRSHHVHAYEADHPEVKRHLDFRDYLRGHPTVRAEYAALKQALACQFPHDIDGYMAGKDTFIRQTIARATAWRAAADRG